MDPLPDFSTLSLEEAARLGAARRLPPVEQWDPPHRGHSDMRIASDGSWYHEGAPIRREEMVRLFSTILRREPDGRHVLVTPAEKLDIDVEDAAFVATAMHSEGEGRDRRIAFSLNSGDIVLLDAEHPLLLRPGEGGPRPYVAVRGGLEARLARSVYYELAAIALAEEDDPPGLWSYGAFFPFGIEED